MWCLNCGTELTEGTKFCSNCGTAVSDTGNTVTVNPTVTDSPSKPKKKTGRVIILSLILGVILYSLISGIMGSPKKVAMDFAEAMLCDFNAKKMVSLMSEDFLNQSMENTGAETEKILISVLKENSKAMEEYYIDEFGESWKVKLEYIDEYQTEDGNVKVAINVNYKGTGGFLGLSDKEKTEKLTLILVDEGGEWKVGGYSL